MLSFLVFMLSVVMKSHGAVTTITQPPTMSNNAFGQNIEFSNDKVYVAAPTHETRGSIVVYDSDNDVVDVRSSPHYWGTFYGRSMAASGDMLVVSGEFVEFVDEFGQVPVKEIEVLHYDDEESRLIFDGRIEPIVNDTYFYDATVAIHNGIVMVGGRTHTKGGSTLSDHAVYFYKNNTSGSFELVKQINNPYVPTSQFGVVSAISNKWIVIAAPFGSDNEAKNGIGLLEVYSWDGTDVDTMDLHPTGLFGSANDNLNPYKVVIVDDTIYVASDEYNKFTVFTNIHGSNIWIKETVPVPYIFVNNIAVTDDHTVFVGVQGGYLQKNVYEFRRVNGVWSMTRTFNYPDDATSFGNSLAIGSAGTKLYVGGARSNLPGRVFVYDIEPPTTTSTPTSAADSNRMHGSFYAKIYLVSSLMICYISK